MDATTNGHHHGVSSYDADLDSLYAWMPPQAAPAVLPEAPASCNVYVMISGHKVQVTLRDSDEHHMLQRLAVVLEQFPAPEAPVSQAADVPHCPTHGALRQGKRGWFCPTRLDDETWCTHRAK
jgi:hypothetical protein